MSLSDTIWPSVTDALEDKKELEWEQAALDGHDDKVANLFVHLERLASSAKPTTKAEDEVQHVVCKHIVHLEQSLWKVNIAIKLMGPGAVVDRCHLEQYEEQVSGLKLEKYQ